MCVHFTVFKGSFCSTSGKRRARYRPGLPTATHRQRLHIEEKGLQIKKTPYTTEEKAEVGAAPRKWALAPAVLFASPGSFPLCGEGERTPPVCHRAAAGGSPGFRSDVSPDVPVKKKKTAIAKPATALHPPPLPLWRQTGLNSHC